MSKKLRRIGKSASFSCFTNKRATQFFLQQSRRVGKSASFSAIPIITGNSNFFFKNQGGQENPHTFTSYKVWRGNPLSLKKIKEGRKIHFFFSRYINKAGNSICSLQNQERVGKSASFHIISKYGGAIHFP